MSSYTRDSLQQALKNQVNRLKKQSAEFQKQSKRLSGIRLVAFLIGVLLVYLAASTGIEILFWTVLIAFIAGFATLASYHKRIERAGAKFKIWEEIRGGHVARLNLDWDNIPFRQISIKDRSHPFSRDLNITGRHSLIQLIDTSIYDGGQKQLSDWLLETEPDSKSVSKRQKIVKSLTPMAHFRDRLHLRARLSRKQELETDWSMDRLVNWLQKPDNTNYKPALYLLSGLAGLNILLVGLYLAGLINPYVIFSFVIYLAVYNFNSEKIQGLYDEAYQIEKLLSQFNSILHYLEFYPYKQTPLKNFCRTFRDSEDSPSKFVKRIIKISSAASSQQSEIVWLLLNFLVPWDLYFKTKLKKYKKELSPRLSDWVGTFYKLEAYCSLANFAWLNPHYTFAVPQATTGSEVFNAEGLGHPLIPEKQKITNDFTVNELGDIILVTGSNMAGKSTFLRTIGINHSLCFAGGPVNANSFNTRTFRLFSSINVSDSLDDGISHFYAEVKRLRTLLTKLEDNRQTPVLFLVDEIFKGTNNRERLQGSEAFLKYIAGKNGVGFVSTHDLELAQLEKEISQLSNWHFAETIKEGKMSFEYKIKPGPCPTTNALTIMKMEGLPI